MAARTPPRLLERERETRLLLDAWRDAARGHGSLWFLCAEAGGGKSRLAAEVARAAGSRALVGAADPVTPPEPYLALSHALPGFEPAPGRPETFRRVLALLQERASSGPVLLVLDDLHFADEGTVAVVVRLGAACRDQPWLVLAAYRPGEEAAALHAGATEVRGDGLADRELDLIYADSGGNPWFAQALAEGSGAVGVARDRMRLRLDRVEAATPGANAVLAALAPATRPLPHAVVASLR